MGIPIIGDLIDGVKDLVSEVIVDKDKRDQVNLELAKLQDSAQARLDAQVLAQVEVNKVEAASGSIFVAGWRPAVGWVGASALAYSYILSPILVGLGLDLPTPDYSGLMNIVLAMLGIGGMRTYEKVKGVSTNNYTDTPQRTPTETKQEVEERPSEPPKKKPQSKPYRHFKI